jgi:hypothetical protein
MPYFRRAPLDEPVRGGGARAVADLAPANVVERATAILGRESLSSAAGLAASPQDALAGGLAPGALPADVSDLPSELQRRASDLLTELLGLFGQSVPIPPIGLPAYAGKAADGNVGLAVPMVGKGQAVKAGDSVKVVLPLRNDAPNAAKVILNSTDFISDGGHVIPALQVTFSPRTLTLDPAGKGQVTVHVAVPPQSAPGAYAALVQAIGLGGPSAVVVLQVG